MSRRRHEGLGDGDVCPLNPSHGQMFFMQGSDIQWCPDVEHDGRPKTHPQGPAAQTRSRWPKGTMALHRAVIQTTLPEIDIALIGG